MADSNNGTKLDLDEILKTVAISGKQMPNGERRYRLLHTSGLSMSMTVMPVGSSGWQNSHQHLSDMIETYCIHRGSVILAVLHLDGVKYSLFKSGQNFTVTGGGPHNIYVSEDTIFTTSKYGSEEGRKDWEAYPELDVLLQSEASRIIWEAMLEE